MTIVSDDRKWRLYYECVIALSLSLILASASFIKYDHKWCHNLEQQLLMSLKV